ncbi:MAG: aminoacetone oxidase family FAD-binding enzyme [Bacilli bacterium]|jgi:hypothetical protein
MKIAIIGAGASGLVAAIKIKEKDPKTEVFLFERLDAVGKKIKATGNGKCNIGNLSSTYERYSHSDFVDEVLGDYHQSDCLLELGIPTKVMYGEGLYPVSESAYNVVSVLENRARQSGVTIVVNTHLVDYQIDRDKVKLQFDKYQTIVDKVIFAVGGKSNPNLGSDGCLFDVFTKHGYTVNSPLPGLCPIRVSEDVKSLFGQRLHAIVSLFINGEFIREEYGEVMFKKDGLSGIVIMNLSSMITRLKAREAKIYLAVLNQDQEVITAKNIIDIANKNVNPLLSFVGSEVAEYIYGLAHLTPNHFFAYDECQKLAQVASALPFTYRDSYDFSFSQVTIGGIAVDELNRDLSSKRESNVYFIGEVIDVDGPCGGYNLRWAIGSALKVGKNI